MYQAYGQVEVVCIIDAYKFRLQNGTIDFCLNLYRIAFSTFQLTLF